MEEVSRKAEIDYQDVSRSQNLVDALGLNEGIASTLREAGSGYNLQVKRALLHQLAYSTAVSCKTNCKGETVTMDERVKYQRKRVFEFVRNHKGLEDVEMYGLESLIAVDSDKPGRECICKYYNGESRRVILKSGIIPMGRTVDEALYEEAKGLQKDLCKLHGVKYTSNEEALTYEQVQNALANRHGIMKARQDTMQYLGITDHMFVAAVNFTDDLKDIDLLRSYWKGETMESIAERTGAGYMTVFDELYECIDALIARINEEGVSGNKQNVNSSLDGALNRLGNL